MGIARRAATTTERRTEARTAAPATPARVEKVAEAPIDPAFHRAILKIALELKKPSARGYDEIVDQTIRAMRLDPVAFRRYLGENGARGMSLLLATARAGGV